MFIVYAVPYAPPAPSAPEWTGVAMTWTGWDGSLWDLLDWRSSGVYLRQGVRGLTKPQFARFKSSSAGVAGARYRGSRALEREVFWPLTVYTDHGSADWIELERAFWRSMDPDRPGTWTVTTPDGNSRSLRLRLVDDGETPWLHTPGLRGWAQYGVYLEAEDPFWRGAPIVRRWAPSEGGSFFGEGGGPPFYISSGSTLASATVTNPGDESAFPVWLVHGRDEGATSVTLGVDGREVVVPFAVPAGTSLVVDTRPTAQTAVTAPTPADDVLADDAALLAWLETLTGTTRTKDLGSATAFGPVPAGQSVPLSIELVGEAVVQMVLVPSHHRAWG